MKDCLFCKIASKEIPSNIIWEDENFISFLDINPKAFSHCLVIPKKHYEDIHSYEERQEENIIYAIKKVCLMMKTNLRCDGINVLQNNGKLAGQIIGHIHFHIMPRFKKEPVGNKKDFKAVLRMIKGE